jgi:hypothetical protein
LWITAGGGKLAKAVANSIDAHEQFSTAVMQSKIKPRTAEVALVSLNGDLVDYVGISQVGRRVATGQVTIAVSNLKEIGLLCEEIGAALPSRFAKYFWVPAEGAYRPTPRLWEEILNAIRDQRPDVGTGMSWTERAMRRYVLHYHAAAAPIP